MREKRGKLAKTISRNKILELLDMNEDEIHEYGISINQMKKVFTFFNIPVKLYNFQCQLLYRFEPNDFKNGRRKTIFVAMIKNNHVYPINANQDTLAQLKHVKPLELTASSNFYINDRDEPPKYKMFGHIDELLKMTDEEEYFLIHKDNDLNEVLFQLKQARYDPYIRYQGNRLAELRVRYTDKKTKKVIHYIIKTQDLAKDDIERDVYTETEDEYNKIVEANFNFHKHIFSESHKSKYDETDVAILDECRTIVPSGYLDKNVDVTKLVEIDRTKAFTWAFTQIKFIPVFNEFDSWKHYTDDVDVNKLSSLTLYMVEVKACNIFFNKKYNLVYGKFLRKLLEATTEIRIICYKIPSFIHKVNYGQIVDELWETELTKDDKKKIGNITFGMLEKSYHPAQKSYCFNSLREACHYQKEYGGRIYAIQQEVKNEEERYMGNTYYILN